MTEKVQILDDRSHILQRPGMWIGGVSTENADVYVKSGEEIILKNVDDFCEGLIHLIKEILDNAADNCNRKYKNPQSFIKVSMDEKSVTVTNDGKPIPIEKIDIKVPGQGTKNMYRSEALFDYYKSGTNFDSKEKCICKDNKRNPKCPACQTTDNIGMNGIGSKAALVFSKYAKIHHADPDNGKQLTMEFYDNHDTLDDKGKRKNPVSVKDYKKAKSFTEFYFEPDFKRFGLKKFSQNHLDIVNAMCVNLAFVTGLVVSFNEEKYKVKNLKDLASMYFGQRETLQFKTSNGDQVLLMAQTLEEMENYGSRQLSFINNSCTRNGGIHVRYNENVIGKVFSEWYGNDLKAVDAKKFWIYVVVYNVKAKLTFSSQTKAELKGPTNIKKIEVEKKDFNKVKNWELYVQIQMMLDGKTQRLANKDVKTGNSSHISTGKKGIDANNAGDKNLKSQTSLYLAEGDSAKAFLTDSIDVDFNGVLALKGKVPNVHSNKKHLMNNEYQMIRKMLGLKMGCKYDKKSDVESLRYGQVIIATDMDEDGYHICALLHVFFWSQHPGLLDKKTGPYVKSLVTPVLKTSIGKEIFRFYMEEEFNEWYKTLDSKQQSHVDKNTKYFKGLGGNNPEKDGDYVFNTNFTTNSLSFESGKDVKLIDACFSDKNPDLKKKIALRSVYNPEFIRDIKYGLKPFEEFIKNDYVGTIKEQNERSIPCVYDGFKSSQKDIMFTAMTKLNSTEYKTKQFATLVATHASYSHGEDNLPPTITGMSQDIIGTNNIAFFRREGSFGNRYTSGTSHGASAERYTYIAEEPLMKTIFNVQDLPILTYISRNGHKDVTPEYLLPIIPMFLTNHNESIGNGWSTTCPAYNPVDLVAWVRTWIDNNFREKKKEYKELIPWYNGYEGIIEKYENGWIFKAVVDKISDDTWEIKEIPVGVWGDQMKSALEYLADQKLIEKPKMNITHNHISAVVKCKKGKSLDLVKELSSGKSEKIAGKGNNFPPIMFNKLSMNNITFIHSDGPHKTNNLEEHLEAYCHRRYKGYVDRRKYNLQELLTQIKIKKNRMRYIQEINDGNIVLKKISDKEELEGILRQKEYELVKESYDYLTDLSTMSLLKKNIAKFAKEIEKLENDYEILKNTKPWQLWLDELKIFDSEYEKYLKRNPVHRKKEAKKGKNVEK